MIETDEEHDRLLTVAEDLMDRGAALSGEEQKLLELVVLLIHSFESHSLEESEEDEEDDAERPPLPHPHETLQRLMQSRGWEHDVLTDVFGNPHLVDEVLAGRRPVSRGQAKALAKLFRVPVKLFVA